MKTLSIKNPYKLFTALVIFIFSISLLLFAARYNTAKAGSPGVSNVTQTNTFTGFTEYLTISNIFYPNFESNIKTKLKSGWSLAGGIFVVYGAFNINGQADPNGPYRLLYLQTMVK